VEEGDNERQKRPRARAGRLFPADGPARVTIPLTDLPSRTVEETVAEKDYALVCHGSRALAVYQGKRDGLHRLKRLLKVLELRP
jgi:hypothetical protein